MILESIDRSHTEVHELNDKVKKGLWTAYTSRSFPAFELALQGDEQLRSHLEEDGLNIHSRNAEGWSALHVAASGGHSNALQRLIKHGGDLHAHTDKKRTPLMLAAWNFNVEAVLVLLDAGSDVNAKDMYNNSAMFYSQGSARDRHLMTPLDWQNSKQVRALLRGAIIASQHLRSTQ
eukprot:m.271950 g.271950  ORF g.271950 m.271950 type:complete len:177 (+) comp19746_c0_seq48:3534-4064(+)